MDVGQRERHVTNPLFYDEFSDPDLIRVGEDYYLTGTTMHAHARASDPPFEGPGELEAARIRVRAVDLGPGVPVGAREAVYGQGIWAPSFRYHDGTFYIFSNINRHQTQHVPRQEPTGPVDPYPDKRSFHDLSVLFDDDGKIYVIWGYQGIRFAQLDEDLTDVVPGTEKVVIQRGAGMGEGVHLYKIDGRYYIFSA